MNGHFDSEKVRDSLLRAPCIWQCSSPAGELIAYATAGGVVVFIDHKQNRGWTMLTECPSNATELATMIGGFPSVRVTRD